MSGALGTNSSENMGKPSSATSLVVLALLSCLVARNVQGGPWPASKGATPPQVTQPNPFPQPGQPQPVPNPGPGTHLQRPEIQPVPQPGPGTYPKPGPQPGSGTYPGTYPKPGPQPGSGTYPGTNPKPGQQPGSVTYPGTYPNPGPQPGSGTYPGTNPKPGPQPGSGTYPGTNPKPGPQPGSGTYPGTNPKPGPQPGSGTYPGTYPNPGPQPGSGTYPKPGPQPGSGTYPGTYPKPGPQPGSGTYPGTNPKPGPQPGSGTYPKPGPQPGSGTYPGTNPKPGPQPGSGTYPGTYPKPGPQPGSGTYPGTYPGQPNIKPAPQQRPSTYPGTYPKPGPQPGSGTYPGTYPGQPNIKPAPQQRPSTYPGQTNIQPPTQQRPSTYPGQTNIQPPTQQRPSTYPGQTNIQPPTQQRPSTYPGQTNIQPPTQQRPSTYPGQSNIQPPTQQRPSTYPGQSNIQPSTQQRPSTYPSQNQVYYDQSQQEPQISPPQKPQPRPILPKDHNDLSCEVDRNVRIPCGGPQISAAGCEAINCCFDGQQCFFGKAVTIQCTRDAQFIVVVARDATLPNIDLESISMLGGGQGCTHVDSNSEFAIYQFPVTGCGSVVSEEPGTIVYENRMSSSFEILTGERGIITRDSQFELIFQCRFRGTSVETLVVEVFPLQEPPLPVAALGPIRVEMRLANGQCLTKGCNEVDAAYSSYYLEANYPVTTVLRDPVYVEVQLLGRTDPNLVLTLGHCWTTTGPNPHSLPQWDILIDGCPYRDDRYLSSLVPVDASSGLDFPSHYRRFIFKMFTFVDTQTLTPMRELVYIHCSTTVCSASSGRCEPSCFRKSKRDVEEASYQVKAEANVVVSSGPLDMHAHPAAKE